MASDHPVSWVSAEATGTLRTSFPCRGADLVAARACERAVFARSFGNTAEELAAEYGPFDSTTDFGAVFRADGTAVGVVRLIRPSSSRLVKTLIDAAGPPWNLPPAVARDIAQVGGPGTWDVATFGVDAVAAGPDRRVVMALCSVLIGAFRDNEVTSFVAMFDSRARRAFRRLGVELRDLPGAKPAPYLGSPGTVPVYQHLANLHADHASHSPDLHDQVFHGRSIDGLDERLSLPGSYALFATV